MCSFYIVLIDTKGLREQLKEEIRRFAEAMSTMKSGLDSFNAKVEQLAQQIYEEIMSAVSDDDGDECRERKALKQESVFPLPEDIRVDLLPWYTSGFE